MKKALNIISKKLIKKCLTLGVDCDIIYLPLKVFFFVKTFFPSEKVLFVCKNLFA